jgi:hypothetical protein
MNKIEFRKNFEPLPNGFSGLAEFADGAFGFSFLKERGEGYASLFKIYIRKEELSKNDQIKAIEASVSYGKKNNDGIILSSSSEKIKKLFDPIDLVSLDDFKYDSKNIKFFYKNK